MTKKTALLLACWAFTVSGCIGVTVPTSVHQPLSARPTAQQPVAPLDGSIYSTSASRGMIFEDRRARNVGDTLTIVISEKTDASKKSNTNTERTSNNSFAVTALKHLPGKAFLGSNLAANSDFSFDGKGESASNNEFIGTITVTVTQVLANGNLLVSGEKQVGINQGSEFIRLSGVVNPVNLTASNTVQSTLVADARIEYRGSGAVSENQQTGWLTRFFLNVLPF